MKLTSHTDYGLRVMIYATLNTTSPSKIKDIAARFDISQSHLTKVVWHLSELGYITTSRGRSGGLSLARPADQIKLGQLIRDLERDPPLVECFVKTSQCAIQGACSAQGMFSEALNAFYATLDTYTLADCARRRDALLQMLAFA